jgi:endonuclease/exonuclease/phosphatase family metal-dependent hydrolase
MAALMCWAIAGRAPAAEPAPRLATWNLEWFMTPETFRELGPRCTPEGERHFGARSMPCEVAASLERSASDITALAAVARRMDADVIALQEVDGPDAARLVFPGYSFCFTAGHELQNTGFAIRPGLAFRCGPDVVDLALHDSLRRGAQLLLFPGTRRETLLLAVHLKSGCPRERLESRSHACERLALQAPLLAGWIATQARAGRRYAILGDFNRELLRDERLDAGLWPMLAVAANGMLRDAAEGAAFRNCWPGQAHPGYIDHILLGGGLAALPGSFERVIYPVEDAWRLHLSDHCPVATRIRVD